MPSLPSWAYSPRLKRSACPAGEFSSPAGSGQLSIAQTESSVPRSFSHVDRDDMARFVFWCRPSSKLATAAEAHGHESGPRLPSSELNDWDEPAR